MHVKALDPNHLVMLGHSGVFGASTPDRCRASNKIAPPPLLPLFPSTHIHTMAADIAVRCIDLG